VDTAIRSVSIEIVESPAIVLRSITHGVHKQGG